MCSTAPDSADQNDPVSTPDRLIRDPLEICESCAGKLQKVAVSDHFRAILGCLVEQPWTTPRLAEMVINARRPFVGPLREGIFVPSVSGIVQ